MTDLASQARPAIEELQQYDEDQLYEELGRRMRIMQRSPETSASFSVEIDATREALPAAEDLKKFGRRFFERVNVQAYTLVCGAEAEDNADRAAVINAFGLGAEAVGPAIAALLVSQLGLAPAIAAVVATLIIRVFFRAAHEAMCSVWKEKLPPGQSGS